VSAFESVPLHVDGASCTLISLKTIGPIASAATWFLSWNRERFVVESKPLRNFSIVRQQVASNMCNAGRL
jgi:hypothetical protein